MSPAKKTTSSRAGGSKKSSVKKTTAKKTTAKKTPAKKTTVKKTTAKKTTAKKTTARKSPVKKSPAKKTAAKKAPAKKTTTKAAPKKTTAKKTTAKASAGPKKAVAAAPATSPTGRRTGKPQFKTPIRKLPVKKSKPARPAKLDKATLKAIREQLMGERGNLVKQQEELEEDSFDGTQSELTGEVGLDEDFADAGTATFDRERDLSIRNNIRDLIDQIDRAVRRIDEGSYGTCERCGKPIDAARVKALPHASLCLDCKRREERVR